MNKNSSLEVHYENPLYIWGKQIPGNNKRLKTDVLNIHEYAPHDLFEKYPESGINHQMNLEIYQAMIPLVYRQEIEHGPAELTYTDRPFSSSLFIGRKRSRQL